MHLHPLQQHAMLNLQLTATTSLTHLSAASSHLSASSFLPALKLLTGSPSHDVCQLAGKLLSRRMAGLLGNSPGKAGQEEEVWLEMLPRQQQADDRQGAIALGISHTTICRSVLFHQLLGGPPGLKAILLRYRCHLL